MEVDDIIQAVAAATFTARVTETLSGLGKPGTRLGMDLRRSGPSSPRRVFDPIGSRGDG